MGFLKSYSYLTPIISSNTVPLCVFEKGKGCNRVVYFSHLLKALHSVIIFPALGTFLGIFCVLL